MYNEIVNRTDMESVKNVINFFGGTNVLFYRGFYYVSSTPTVGLELTVRSRVSRSAD